MWSFYISLLKARHKSPMIFAFFAPDYILCAFTARQAFQVASNTVAFNIIVNFDLKNSDETVLPQPAGPKPLRSSTLIF